jgi:hypothetical protein
MFLMQNGFLDGIFMCAKLVFFGWNYQKFHAQDICKRGVCTTTHNTQQIVKPWPSPHRRTIAAAASSNISNPTAPILPTPWSLIDYAIGYKEMR